MGTYCEGKLHLIPRSVSALPILGWLAVAASGFCALFFCSFLAVAEDISASPLLLRQPGLISRQATRELLSGTADSA